MLTKLVFISQYVEIPVPCYINLHDAVCQLIKLEKKKKPSVVFSVVTVLSRVRPACLYKLPNTNCAVSVIQTGVWCFHTGISKLAYLYLKLALCNIKSKIHANNFIFLWIRH